MLGFLVLLAAAVPMSSMVPASPAAGDPVTALRISEFRVRGPNGANDEFIEIANTGTDHTVAGGGTGYAVAASDGVARCVIPNGTVLPAGGHYLCVNSVGYSLASYPAGNGTTATGDATYTTDIPDNAGIALFNNSLGGGSFSLANRLDAVGSTSEANTLYKEGTGYAALTPFSIDYSFYRSLSTGSITTFALDTTTPGVPKDTDNNSADFVFVDTNGTSAGAGQRLGAPGPENLSSPVGNGELAVSLLDPCVAATSPPNAVRDFTSDPPNNSTFGTVDFRRTITNSSGSNVTRLRLRVADIRTFPAPSGIADMRPRTSTDVVVTVDRAPCGSGTSNVTVQGTALEMPPSQPNGGGFNSSLGVSDITLGTPLAPGASIDVRLLTGLQQTGTTGVRIIAEALGTSPTTPTLTCLGSSADGDDFCADDPPVAADDAYGVTEDTPLVQAAPGVLANDTDADSATITAQVVGAPANGGLAFNADGSFTYTPDADFNGVDSFTYQATDGTSNSGTATVTITVAAANDAPVAVDDGYLTPEGTPLVTPAAGVLANDSDVDGDTVTVDVPLAGTPAHGSLAINADGSFTYTPDVGYVGTDSFTYVATDGTLDSAAATVTITLSDVDHPPTGGADSYSTPSSTALVTPAPGVLGNDVDLDGETLSAQLVTGPVHGTLTLAADGSFTYTPSVGYDGPDSFTYKAVAGVLQSSPVTVSIDVNFVAPATVPTGDLTLTASDSTPNQGQQIQVTGSGFAPGETVRLVLYSDPVSLGQAVADQAGNLSAAVTVPTSTPLGRHTIVGFSSAHVATASIDVTAAPTLVRTGSNIRPELALAGSLIAIGGVLILVNPQPRRRRAHLAR